MLVEHFPQVSGPYLYGLIVAVRLWADLEAHSWTTEHLRLACEVTADPGGAPRSVKITSYFFGLEQPTELTDA